MSAEYSLEGVCLPRTKDITVVHSAAFFELELVARRGRATRARMVARAVRHCLHASRVERVAARQRFVEERVAQWLHTDRAYLRVLRRLGTATRGAHGAEAGTRVAFAARARAPPLHLGDPDLSALHCY